MGLLIDSGLYVTTCCACGVRFGIDKEYANDLMEQRGGIFSTAKIGFDTDNPPDADSKPEKDSTEKEDRGDRGWFCCPNGHHQRFIEKTSKRLGEQLAESKRKAEHLEAANEKLKKELEEARSPKRSGKASGKRKAAAK